MSELLKKLSEIYEKKEDRDAFGRRKAVRSDFGRRRATPREILEALTDNPSIDDYPPTEENIREKETGNRPRRQRR